MSAGAEATVCSGQLYKQMMSCAHLDAGRVQTLLSLSYDVSGQDLYRWGQLSL